MKNIPYIKILIILVISFLLAYILFEQVRCFLILKNIDPNFITATITIIALLLTIKQSQSDKIYFKNIRLVEVLEEKGLLIIGKLLTIKKKSNTSLMTLYNIKEAINTGKIHKDANRMSEKDDIEQNIESVTASLSVYFGEIADDWNKLQELLNQSCGPTVNILSNYEENIDLLKEKISFKNEAIDSIDKSIEQVIVLDQEIEDLSLKINNRIIEKINSYKNETNKGLKIKL